MEIEEKIETIRKIFTNKVTDPNISNRKNAASVGLSKTTVGRYLDLAASKGVDAIDIVRMNNEEMLSFFNIKESTKKEFIEPDWEKIRMHVQKKRFWGKQLPTIRSTWEYMYIKVFFPNYTIGELPPKCMSERTFDRRYADYLDSIGLPANHHTPNPNNNFGPASMVEIDTVGDKFPYINSEGKVNYAVIFTAVSKYSGYIYAEAMPSSSSLCWATAIVNSFYYFGGCFQVLRTDNDTAITNHHRKGSSNTRARLRATIEYTIRDFDITVDLCPVREPQYKGKNERSNQHLEKHLFEDSHNEGPYLAEDLEDLNKKIRIDLIRINSKPEKGRLSRMAIFEKYEKDSLLPLPLFRPVIKSVSFGYVRQNGYISYLKNYYYAGHMNAGKEVLIVNDQGKRIYLKIDDKKLTPIADYDIDRDIVSPHYHKADQFKSEKENIISRDKEWFIDYFNKVQLPHNHVNEAIEWIFKICSNSQLVATRLCNQIHNMYEQAPENMDCLDATCHSLVAKNKKADLKNQLYITYNTYVKVKELGPDIFEQTVIKPMQFEAVNNSLPPANSTEDELDDDSVRGEAYFDELC